MVRVRRMLSLVAFGSALVAPPARSQQSSTVSLTHTVSVTVPPRVKVEVGKLTSSAETSPSLPATPSAGLAVSVRATQAWALTIGSTHGSSKVQWSTQRSGGFSVVGQEKLVASGELSLAAAAATIFFREGGQPREDESDIVILTVVAP